MAKFHQPTQEELQAWNDWVATRPESIKALAKRFDPWTLYQRKSINQRVSIIAFWEDGTVSTRVSGQFNLVTHERNVFGVDPDDLVECDLPRPDEILGSFLTQEEVHENIDALRAMAGIKVKPKC